MIIAIDGPAGAGKSTVATLIAGALGLRFLDTGAMYRAVTLEVLRRGLDPASEEDCGRVARSVELAFDARGKITIDGVPGEPAIRSREVTTSVSAVSAHGAVRGRVVERQRHLAASWGGLVAEGRDTTTVVFPQATHKFFLIASAHERARRRALEIGEPQRADAIQAEIEHRDALDTSRAHSPLRCPPDAIVVDTSGLDAREVADVILGHVQAARR